MQTEPDVKPKLDKIKSWLDSCGLCRSCGMDMDMAPYCVNKQVIELRTKEKGAYEDYPFGLDLSRAWSLCQLKFWEKKSTSA